MFPGRHRPYLTLTFPVCSQSLKDFHSQILCVCLCSWKMMLLAFQSVQGGGEQGTTLGSSEETVLTRELIPECSPIMLIVDRVT